LQSQTKPQTTLLYNISLLFSFSLRSCYLFYFTVLIPKPYAWQPHGGVGGIRQRTCFVGCLTRTEETFSTIPREFDIKPWAPSLGKFTLLQHSALGIPPSWHLCLVSSAGRNYGIYWSHLNWIFSMVTGKAFFTNGGHPSSTTYCTSKCLWYLLCRGFMATLLAWLHCGKVCLCTCWWRTDRAYESSSVPHEQVTWMCVTAWAIWHARRKAIHEGLFQSPH
jgi:hypothetical protein